MGTRGNLRDAYEHGMSMSLSDDSARPEHPLKMNVFSHDGLRYAKRKYVPGQNERTERCANVHLHKDPFKFEEITPGF